MLHENLEAFLKESNAIEGVYDEESLADALVAWEYVQNQKELTSQIVCRAHKLLMVHQPLDESDKGRFRRTQVWVSGREGVPYPLISAYMNDWCWMNNHAKTEEKIQEEHVRYEYIHPFVDGNGRTGRLFLNYQRVKSGLPILVLTEAKKHAYYQWFQEGTD